MKKGSAPQQAPYPERPVYEYGGDASAVKLRVALGFPANYRAGMANLAFLWIHHLLNREPGVRCDRFFEPDGPGGSTATLETGRPLARYDVVAFSLPFEPGYAGAVRLLERGGVEIIAEKRRGLPLVIAGGTAVSANPEPVADFFDAIVIGEAEAVLPKLIPALTGAVHANLKTGRADFLKSLAEIPGVYVPSLYQIDYNADGTIREMKRKDGKDARVHAARLEKIDEPAHAGIVAPRAAFGDMFLIELSRGCPFSCRFCLTRHTGHGFRAAEEKSLVAVAQRGLDHAPRLGLVGTAFASAGAADAVCRAAAQKDATVSFSSIRLTGRVMKLFHDWSSVIDNRTLAVAPEAASPRLRRVIDKDLEQPLEQFLSWELPRSVKKIKLYYLIGIPGESDEDADAIASEAARAGESMSKKKIRVSLSVNPMVSKAHTPMQWTAPADRGALRARLRRLRAAAAERGVNFSGMGARESEIQTALSLGDRRVAPVIRDVARGADTPSAYVEAFKKNEPGLEFYAHRKRNIDEILPWRFIDHGVSGAWLRRQYEELTAAAGI